MAPPKSKGQKMALGEFLQDKALGSWADEMEDVPMPSAPSGRPTYGRDQGQASGGYGSGGFAEKGGYSVREQLPLPTKPPYTVHLGNMSFDATEGDIQDFFRECSVTNVRIVEDKVERKPKGFGYAEFSSLEGLKKALTFNNSQFQGRNIRVSVAEPQKDRPDAREFGDWTRKGPLPDIAGQRQRPSDRFGRDNSAEAGGERDSRRRPGYEQADSKVRDFDKWDRKGPLTPILPNGPSKNLDRPVSHDGPRDRRNSPAWGEGRSQDGSRPPRREFSEKPMVERTPTAPELDNQWRTKMRPDPPAPTAPVAPARSPALSSREISAPSSPSTSQAPTVRPKLNLAKRTVTEVPKASPTLSGESKSSPFGGATPIDTAAREKEIEEKRQHALRERREVDDKAREEKRLAREAERSQRASVSKEKSNEQDTEKENGAATQSTKTYEILRRMTNDTTTTDTDTDAAGENGTVVDDKSVKPKEITRDVAPKKVEGGALANGNTTSQADASADTTAGALEGDGWSTVSKPRNQRRNGNQASRAMAS